MEFEEQFAVIQGSLITLKKKLGDLDMLSSDKDDDISKMKSVAKILIDVVHGGKNIRRADDNALRKLHMFLILNTNLQVMQELEEDDNCGHIVGCAPVISKDLYLELVYSLALQKYFCEAVVYAPFSLVADLLESALLKLDGIEFSEKLVKASQYGTAVYHKFRLLDSNGSEKKYDSAKISLYKHFRKILEVFQKPSATELPYSSINELYNIAGLAMENLLELFNNCLKLYINHADIKCDYQDIYRLKLSECLEENSKETNVTSETIIAEMLNVCNSNFPLITVDMFLYWADCFINKEAGKSLQQSIREAMYFCAQNLKSAQKKGIHSNVAEQVLSALESMGDKPPDEDDEIREADLNVIVKNVSDETKAQRKWFKALVQYSVKLSDGIYFKALEQHLKFADTEDVKTIIEKTMDELISLDTVDNMEALKNFALAGVKDLHTEEQLNILDWFLNKYGVTTVLKKDEFSMEMVHMFNKSVHLSKEEMELVSEIVYLCLQSPYDIIARMIREGLLSTEQGVLMVKILKYLKPVKNIYVMNNGEIKYSKTEKNGSTIIMHNIQNLMKENLNDKERQCFVPLVTLLVTDSLIDGSSFITEILLPHIYEIHESNEENLLLCLETLYELMNVEMLSSMKQLCPLLVFLGSLFKRWSIYTFTMKSVIILQKIHLLLKRMFKYFLANKPVEDKEVIWLQHKLKGLAPLNKCYFKEAWNKFGKSWITNPNSVEVILLELMVDDADRISDITKSFGDTQDSHVAFILAKILPQCTPLEWKSLVRNLGKLYNSLSDSKTGELKAAEIFTDSLLILVKFADWENAHSCLDYCVRNIGIAFKENILPKLDGSQPEALIIIFQKVCYGLGLLPDDVREQCSTVIVNVLVDIVQKIADAVSENMLVHKLEDLTRTLGILHDGKASQVLANRLLVLKTTEKAT